MRRKQPPLPEEQIAAAKAVNLLEYMLRYEPDNLILKGNQYRHKVHSSLVISLDGSKWHWFAGQLGGGAALYYLTQVDKLPFREAVERLTSSGFRDLPPPPALPPPEPVIRKPFALPEKCRSSDRALDYLIGRGIDRDIVRHCIRQGTVYESYPHHNVVFVGKDPSGTPRYAGLRGTGSDHFRMDHEGSDKRYSFCYVPPGCDPRVQRWIAGFEAPIDALSFATLNRRYHIHPVSWDKLPCLSLSGTAPAALIQYLTDHPAADTVYLCLDNDAAGQKGVETITRAIREDHKLSAQVKHIIPFLPEPEFGKDYNDMLRTLSAKDTHQQTL